MGTYNDIIVKYQFGLRVRIRIYGVVEDVSSDTHLKTSQPCTITFPIQCSRSAVMSLHFDNARTGESGVRPVKR